MSAVPYERHDEDWETTEQEQFASPGRPRRRFFNRRSAALAAVITCAAGFYAGVRVEKSQLSTASATASATGAQAGGSTATRSSVPGGFAGGGQFGGGAGGGGNASLGTISSVSGNTLYLTDTTGNTVKVTLSSATKLTKSLGVSKSSLRPGDSIVVQGVKSSSGTIVATSLSDTGARSTGAGSSTGSSSGGATGTATNGG
jgi:hypothetical protein